VALAFAGIHGANFFNLAFGYFAELGGFERNVVWTLQHKILGGKIYENPNMLPFSITQYGPGYYYLANIAAHVLGIDGANSRAVIALGRSLNILLLMGLSGLAFGIARFQFRQSIFASLFASLVTWLILGQNFISGRPDALKAFFTILTFAAAIQFLVSDKFRWQAFSFFFAACALLTKQDGIIAFFPIFAFYLFSKPSWDEWLKSAALATGFGILVAGIIVTHPSAVYNLTDGLKNGISLSWFLSAFGNFFAYLSFILLLGVVASIRVFSVSKPLAILSLSFLLVYTVFPALFSLKFGSGPNYFNEVILISAILSAVVVDHFRQQFPQVAFAVFTGFLLVFQGVTAIREVVSLTLGNHSLLKSQFESQAEIARWIKAKEPAPHSVLCLITRQWEDHFTNLASNLILVPQRDVMEQVFNAAPKTPLVIACKTHLMMGKVRYIVTDKPQIPSFLGLTFQPSVAVFEKDGYFVFENPLTQ
jgi:hypothetical protein